MSSPRAQRPQPRPGLGVGEGYHSPQLDVAVRLNTNESPEPPPEAWADEVAEAVRRIDWHRYPDRDATRLRAALAELHGVAPEQILCANGSNEVLQSVLLTYGGAGQVAAMWEPTYALHSHIARITGTAVVAGERGAGGELDPEEVARLFAAQRPSVVFMCSPNSPTGRAEPEQDVRAVLERCREVGALLVVDEAYAQFARWSALELLDEDAPLVVTRTFSKTWAMAGARLGYLVGPTWVVREVARVLLPYHLDAFTQVAGELALRHEDEMHARVARLVDQREQVVAALDDLGVQRWPSEANFVLFRPRRADGSLADRAYGDAVWQALVDRSVLVRNCASWPRLDGCLRVTIGSPEECTAFVDALRDALDEVRAQESP